MLEKETGKAVEKGVEAIAEKFVEKTGLFIATYDIGTGALGAPNFHLGITVNTADKTLSGAGRITQPVNPPVDVSTHLLGTYTPMWITPPPMELTPPMGAKALPPEHRRIFVVAIGTPGIAWLVPGGFAPNIQPNVHLRMILSADWRSGIAWYKYLGADGKWAEVPDVPVKLSATTRTEARG